MTYQNALQVVGTNISNAGNADYVRQTPGLSAINGAALPEGMQPGAGVALSSLKRNMDEALENRIRVAIGQNESLTAQRGALAQVETIFDPVIGLPIQENLNAFFNNMNELQNSPADNAVRDLAVNSAATLAGTLRETRARLTELGGNLNDDINAIVVSANRVAEGIAQLNTEIVTAEASGAPASALRDQRDALVRDLSEWVEVTVRVQENGTYNVYIGNESLVQGRFSRGLTVVRKLDGEFRRDNVAFADTNAQVPLGGGRLAGLIEARDEQAFGRITEIDGLAAAVIFEVNRIHADGQGTKGFSSLVSRIGVNDTSAALNSTDAGIPFPPANGSFYISVRDANTGVVNSFQIEVDLDGEGVDTSLESLVADINANVVGVSATITDGNQLALTAEQNLDFTFGNDGQSARPDSSNLLAALGINTFFAGSDAASITVDDTVFNDSRMLAAASVNLTGDGTNAGRLALIGEKGSDLLGGASILDSYIQTAGGVAVSAARSRAGVQAAATVLGSLQAEKENISGVSLDEEAIELLKYERAFQGAARFVSVVDRLTSEMISLVN